LALVIAIFVAITLAVAAYIVWPRTPAALLQFDGAPDTPIGFGPDMSWLAVRTTDTARLTQALGMRSVRACNWSSGIGAVYDARFRDAFVFITPPIDGWSFVIGRGLPHPLASHRLRDHNTPLLESVSQQFGECQYFGQFPDLDMTAWLRAVDGAVVRGFAANSEGPYLDVGRATKVERTFALGNFDLVGVQSRRGDVGGRLLFRPKPQHVFEIAARWSRDPSKLGKLSRFGTSAGVIGYAPSGWRPVVVRETPAQAA
jgi:hypothetical protein